MFRSAVQEVHRVGSTFYQVLSSPLHRNKPSDSNFHAIFVKAVENFTSTYPSEAEFLFSKFERDSKGTLLITAEDYKVAAALYKKIERAYKNCWRKKKNSAELFEKLICSVVQKTWAISQLVNAEPFSRDVFEHAYGANEKDAYIRLFKWILKTHLKDLQSLPEIKKDLILEDFAEEPLVRCFKNSWKPNPQTDHDLGVLDSLHVILGLLKQITADEVPHYLNLEVPRYFYMHTYLNFLVKATETALSADLMQGMPEEYQTQVNNQLELILNQMETVRRNAHEFEDLSPIQNIFFSDDDKSYFIKTHHTLFPASESVDSELLWQEFLRFSNEMTDRAKKQLFITCGEHLPHIDFQKQIESADRGEPDKGGKKISRKKKPSRGGKKTLREKKSNAISPEELKISYYQCIFSRFSDMRTFDLVHLRSSSFLNKLFIDFTQIYNNACRIVEYYEKNHPLQGNNEILILYSKILSQMKRLIQQQVDQNDALQRMDVNKRTKEILKLKGYEHLTMKRAGGNEADIFFGARDGHNYAIKVFKDIAEEHIYAKNRHLAKWYRRNLAEALGARLSHPFLLPICDTIIFEQQVIALVSPRYQGSLIEFVSEFKPKEHFRYVQSGFKGILEALEYLHSQGFVHLDVKLENIFYNKDQGGYYEMCLGDLGFLRDVDYFSHQPAGTPSYAAPELYQLMIKTASDMWSFGVCIFAFWTGRILTCDFALAQHVLSNFSCMHPAVKDFLFKCFYVDPAQRITASEALKHPMFANDPSFF